MRKALFLIGAALCAVPSPALAAGSLIFVSDVRIAEPTSLMPVMAVFEVKLEGASAFPVTVNWATQDVLAKSPVDYAASSGTLTFDADGTREIAVRIERDQESEGAETFLVNLTSPVGAVLNDGQAHGVIEDQGQGLGPGRAKCDFGGDGRSDVLVRRVIPDHSHGAIVTHYNGHEEWNLVATVASQDGGSIQASKWYVLATDDFNGVGSGCDILWVWKSEDAGDPDNDLLAVTRETGTSSLRAPATADHLPQRALSGDWQFVGSGQFTSDTRADVLWWNEATGELLVWESDGSGFAVPHALQTNPDVQWRPSAVLDIDADGDADILWRHTVSGALVYWRMQQLAHADGGYFAPNLLADPCWQLVATGDFNGDGNNDILWQNQNSQRAVVWFMRGTERIGGTYLSPDRFGEANPDLTACPGPCQRDCSRAEEPWFIEGPR